MMRRRMAWLTAALVLVACDDGPSSSGTQAFTVSVTQPVREPATADAGLLVVIDGSGIRNVRAAGDFTVISRAADGDRVAVAVLGDLSGGPLLVFDGPQDRSAADYEARVEQAAGPDFALRADVAEYAADVAPH